MDKNKLIKFYEIIDGLEEEYLRYLEINNEFIAKMSEYTKTEDGAQILDIINNAPKIKKETTTFLQLSSFKNGLIIGMDLENVNIKQLQEIDDFGSKKENKEFFSFTEKYNKLTINVIGQLDMYVDILFSTLYSMNNRKKDNGFWKNYKEELIKFCNIDIEPIQQEMINLKDLRKVRNVYQHDNGNIDEQFVNYFKPENVHNFSKVLVSPISVIVYFASATTTFFYIIKEIKDIDYKYFNARCPNLLTLVESYNNN